MDAPSRHAAKAGRTSSCSSAATANRCMTSLLGGGGGGGGGSGAALVMGGNPNNHVLKCPRCDSFNTKFCYYNNYSLLQPRHFCKNCRRYWTKGGALRNVPVGGGCRKSKRSSTAPVLAGASANCSSTTTAILTSPPPKRVMNIMIGDNSASCMTNNTASGTAHLIAPVPNRPQYSDLNLQPSVAAALQGNLSPTNTYYKLYTAPSKTGLIDQPSSLISSFSIQPNFSSCAHLSPQSTSMIKALAPSINPCISSISPSNPSTLSLDSPTTQPAIPGHVLASTYGGNLATGSLFHINEINPNDSYPKSSSFTPETLTSSGDCLQRMTITSSSTPPTIFSTNNNAMTSHAGNILDSLALSAMNDGNFTQSLCRADQYWSSRGTMQIDQSCNKELGSLRSGQLQERLQYFRLTLQDQMSSLAAPDHVEEGAVQQVHPSSSTKTELVSDNFNMQKGSCFPDCDHAGHTFFEPSVADHDETTYWNSCNPSTTWPDNS